MLVNKNKCPYCRTVRDDICSCCDDNLINCTLSCVRYLFMETTQPSKPYFDVGDYVVFRRYLHVIGQSSMRELGYEQEFWDAFVHQISNINWDSNRETYVYCVKSSDDLVTIASESDLMSYDDLFGYDYNDEFSDYYFA